MSIIKCENGHFFDNSKYSQCPYCSSQEYERNRYEDQIRERVTIAIPKREQEESVTIGLYEAPKSDDQKTIGIFARQSGTDYVTGWLVCIQGKEKGRDYRLHNGNNWIGRSLGMDVCIVDDPGISRENHATIVYDHRSNRFFLVPGSGTLTRLNGELLVKAKELKKRDEILLGESTFAFIPFCEEGHVWKKEEK